MIVTDFQQAHKFTRESEDSHMHWREKAFQECIGISLSPLLLLIITRQDSYLLKNPGSAILKICVPLGKLPYHPNATGENEWDVKALRGWQIRLHLFQVCFMLRFILAASGGDDSLIPQDDLRELTDLDRSFRPSRRTTYFCGGGRGRKDRQCWALRFGRVLGSCWIHLG